MVSHLELQDFVGMNQIVARPDVRLCGFSEQRKFRLS